MSNFARPHHASAQCAENKPHTRNPCTPRAHTHTHARAHARRTMADASLTAYTLRVVNTGGAQVAVETAERDTGDSTTLFVPPGLCRNTQCSLSDAVTVQVMSDNSDAACPADASHALSVASLPSATQEPHTRVGDFLVSREGSVVRMAHGPPVRMYLNVDMSDAGVGTPPLTVRASSWAAPPLTRDAVARSPPDKRMLDTPAGLMATACLVGREFALEHDNEVFALPTAPTTYTYQLDSGSYLYVHVTPAGDRVGDGARTINVHMTFTGELVFMPTYF